jgi:hypothetical protein
MYWIGRKGEWKQQTCWASWITARVQRICNEKFEDFMIVNTEPISDRLLTLQYLLYDLTGLATVCMNVLEFSLDWLEMCEVDLRH